MMDIVSEVPLELSIHIFSFLSFRDLINCFRVCRRWREVANSNSLWKKHCLPYATEDEINKAISRVARPPPTVDFLKSLNYCLRSRDNLPSRNYLGPWCGCARLFKHKYGRHLRNWGNGNFMFNQLMLPEPECNVVCSRKSLILCFYQPNLFGITELTPNGMQEVIYLNIPLPEPGHYDSVQISSEYLAMSCKNTILIYKKLSGKYVYSKTFVLQNDYPESEGVINDRSAVSRDRSFKVALISGQYAWFRTFSHIYIIQLETKVLTKICFENAHIKQHNDSNKVVAWSKGNIKIFTVHGQLIHQRQMRSQIRGVAFEETFTLLCKGKKNSRPYVEWWDPQTTKRRILKRVEGETSMVIRGENVFILEVKQQSYHRVSAIHCATGTTYWIHTITTDNLAVNRFSESIFEGICGRYLFIHVPSVGNNKYYIIDMSSGVGLYSKEFGEGQAYLFNEKVVVITRGEEVWIMNYL